MSEPCSDLVSFADGELDPERAEAFRSHLATCAACRASLLEAIQLDARLSTLTRSANLVPESPTEPAIVSPLASPAETDKPKPKSNRKYQAAAWGGGALALIAAAAIYLFYSHSGAPPDTGGAPPNVFAELKTRPYDVRLAYADAAAHRPPREQMRGSAGPDGESIPYAVLDAFQKRRDGHALAIARVFHGDKPADIAAQLRALPQTPSIRSDRIAIELLATSNDNVEPILAELEALRTSGDPAVARAARWNYALELSRLDLPLSAAHAFREIAEDGEPGWAGEARGRAEREDQRGKDFQVRFQSAREAGKALMSAGTPVPSELVQAFPGLLRQYLYDAVRTAPS